MPIVHSHSLEWQSLAADVYLAAHAVEHHRQDIDHGVSGWHVHFVFPSDGSDDLPGNDDPGAPGFAWPIALLGGTDDGHSPDFASVGTSSSVVIGEDSVQWVSCLVPLVEPAPPPASLKRISPHAWLCIARC